MNRKIKIIQIIPTLDIGGAERLMVDLAKALNKSQFAVKVICLKRFGLWGLELKAGGIPILFINQKYKISLASLFKLVRILKNEQPDIVHTHLFGADIYGKLAAKLAGVRHIISTEHNLNKTEGAIKKLVKKIIFKSSDLIIAVSQAVKDYAIEHEGALADKIKVVYNGVAVRNSLLKNSQSAEKKKIIIGAMGRLTKQKNFFSLISAVAKIKSDKLQCLIAGEGELKPVLEKQIKALRLDKEIKLVGAQKQVNEFLAALDIFVMPSLWEGLGLAVLEAGLAGLPVVATDIDGLKEIIKHQQNGLLVKPGDADDLAEKISYLLDNRAERERLGGNLRQTVMVEFNLEKMVGQYEKIYKDLVNYENSTDK